MKNSRSLVSSFVQVVSKNLKSLDIYDFKAVFLRCKFLRNQVITDNFASPGHLCNVSVVDLGCLTCLLQGMAKNF